MPSCGLKGHWQSGGWSTSSVVLLFTAWFVLASVFYICWSDGEGKTTEPWNERCRLRVQMEPALKSRCITDVGLWLPLLIWGVCLPTRPGRAWPRTAIKRMAAGNWLFQPQSAQKSSHLIYLSSAEKLQSPKNPEWSQAWWRRPLNLTLRRTRQTCYREKPHIKRGGDSEWMKVLFCLHSTHISW